MVKLGNDKSFKKIYEVPILKSRAPDCTAKDKELGEARLEQVRIQNKIEIFWVALSSFLRRSF